MKNSADLGGCYPPKPSVSVDNTLLDLQNSSYPTKPHSIIAKLHSSFNFRSQSLVIHPSYQRPTLKAFAYKNEGSKNLSKLPKALGECNLKECSTITSDVNP